MARPKAGRRAGDPGETRATILDAARSVFAEHGFEKGSLRKIAAEAAVDPSLLLHYFGSKEDLFLAAMRAPLDPRALIAALIAQGPVEQLGERLVRGLLGVWDSPAGAGVVAMMRTALGNERLGAAIREFVRGHILAVLAAHLPGDAAEQELRVTLVASQVVGLAMTRHVLRFEPLASAPADVVVGAVGPTVQRYLTGPLDNESMHV